MTVIEALITLALSNFTVTFLVLGLVAAGVSLLRKRKPLTRAVIVEELLAFFLLFEIGLGNLYNFVMHVFFGEMTASFIGWAQSPFQAEVGFASLGFAVVGLMAFRAGFGLRLAAITGPASLRRTSLQATPGSSSTAISSSRSLAFSSSGFTAARGGQPQKKVPLR
jgi:hypothetical protein